MDFTALALHCTGHRMGRAKRLRLRVRPKDLRQALVHRLARLLHRRLPERSAGNACFRCRIGNRHQLNLEWQQVGTSAALATLSLRGAPTLTAVLLSGLDATSDALAVAALDALLADYWAATSFRPGRDLRTIRRRPLAACLIWPDEHSTREWQTLADVALCLASAFFTRTVGRSRVN